MANVVNSSLAIQTLPGRTVESTIGASMGRVAEEKAEIARGFEHLAEDPYALSARGPLVIDQECAAEYDRPGLVAVSPIGAQIAAMTRATPSREYCSSILDSVCGHPHLQGPIGKGIDVSIASLWPPLGDMRAARAIALAAMAAFPVQHADATGRTNLLDKLEDTDLGDSQKSRIIDIVAEFKNSLDHQRDFDRGASEVNWRHICAEMGQVIDVCERLGLDATTTEDALLASVFSDAVKFGPTLMTHNIDGAVAAYHVLSRRGDDDMSQARIAGIVAATKEHQVAPPGLFAKIAAESVRIPSSVDARRIRAEIRTKISHPMNPQHLEVRPDGSTRIKFSRAAQEALATIGISEWAVPNPKNSWFDASMAVIAGDALINYASPEGLGKIVMLSGPGQEPFTDATVFHSMFCCGVSYLDAQRILPRPLREIYREGAQHTRRTLEEVRAFLLAQLRTGYLVFDKSSFGSLVETDGVDLSKLDAEEHDGSVFVRVPGNVDEIPFVHIPLDYGTRDANYEFAKLIRRNVGDLCRNHMQWNPPRPAGRGG